MSLSSAVRRVAGVAGAFGLVAIAAAQPPEKPVRPANYIPPADHPLNAIVPPAVVKVEITSGPQNGVEAFPKMLTESRTAYAKLRDYTCHTISQERVGGKLLPEQTAELRVRTQPLSINERVTAPKALAEQEQSYLASKPNKVRFRAAGIDGIRYGFQTLSVEDPKVLATSRHPITEVELAAVLDRVEKTVAIEKKLNHAVQILVAEYTFANRPVTRYEIFADRQHPHRVAYRTVLYIDKETKLPVRYEAYDQPRAGGTQEGELLEVVSFVGMKVNQGLGENTFTR